MAQIYNPDEIISKANAMKSQSDELKSLVNQMQSIVNEMSSVWKSPAQDAFKNKFVDIQPQLMSFCTNINSFADRAIAQAEAVKTSEVI